MSGSIAFNFVGDAVVAHSRMKDTKGNEVIGLYLLMEPSAGKRRVTGWRPDLTPQQETSTVLNRSRIQLNCQYLAEYKGQNDVVYVLPSETDTLGGEKDTSLKVGLNIRITQIIGRCQKAKVRKFLRDKRQRACYGTHFADAENPKRVACCLS